LENGSIEKKDERFVLSRKHSDREIPDTIQGIIAARMDRLEDNLKHTMRVASVIGRDFAFRILQSITDMREGLKSHLLNLQGLEFIYEKNLFPELEYIFKHALTQEVAYNSLLQKRRKEIHRDIGGAIEQIYAEKLEGFYEMLAYHFDLGEVWEKAIEYLVQAGIAARRNYSIQPALDKFNRAGEILEKHNPDVNWKIHFDLCFERAGAWMELGQSRYALDDFKTAEDLARENGDKDLRVQVMVLSLSAAQINHEVDLMKEILGNLEPLVADDLDQLLGVVTFQAFSHYLLNDIPMALAKEKELNDLYPRAPNSPFSGLAAVFIGIFTRWRGDYQESSEILGPVREVLKTAAEPVWYLMSVFFHGLSLGEQGRYQEAIQIMEEGRDFGLKAGEKYVTPKVTNSLGWAYHELCMFDRAIDYNNLALESIREMLGPGTSDLFEIESQTRVNLGENYLLRKDMEKSREQLELVYDDSQKPEYFFMRARWKPRCMLSLGEYWVEAGDIDRAELFLVELKDHKWTDSYPYKKYQVRALRLKGLILSARGLFDEAAAELKKAISQAGVLGNPTQLWKSHEVLGDVLLSEGKNEEARGEFQAAAQVVKGIAEGLTDVALKDGYLKSEPIQELFSLAEGG
jgi:tetratricopeptide (TPR) repeat protein